MKHLKRLSTGAGVALLAAASALAQAPAAPPLPSAPDSDGTTRTPLPPAGGALVPAPAQGAAPPLQSALSSRLLYELLVGELLFVQGDPGDGASLVLDAARRTRDESLFKRAAEMAIASRSGPAALDATRAWHQALPGSVEAARYELQVLIVLGRVAETEAPLRALVTTLPPGDRVAFITAVPALYQRVADKTEAAAVVERALADAARQPALAAAAWTTIGRMRLQAGDTAGALAAATLGQSADATSEWPALLALHLMAGAGEPQAETLVRHYVESPAARSEVAVAYARALLERGRAGDAHAQLDRLVQRHPDEPEAWLVRGALRADERDDSAAQADLQRYLALLGKSASADEPRPGADHARLMLARIAERRGDFAEAERLLNAVTAPEQALPVVARRAQMLARQGRLAEARELIRNAPAASPDDALQKLLAEAQLLRDERQFQPAYDLLAKGLATSPDDETLLYETAMAAERVGQLDDMERLLRRLIEQKPDSAAAYNALGFSLADRGLRLAEARTLIEKAVALAPGDAYIQDSLGWVQFRQGDVAAARKTLEDAYRKRRDAEIAAHLGEVLWQQGERDAALRIWREGLRLDAQNETLRETLKRLGATP